jgi:hypothetical protein
MPPKLKDIIKNCKDKAREIQKFFEENKKIVDPDFLNTIDTIISRLNEFQHSEIKNIQLNDGKKPFPELERLLSEYHAYLLKIQNENRLRRYMQSTRIRRNLDLLNNACYAVVRAVYRKVHQKKDKSKARHSKESSAAISKIPDTDAQKIWSEHLENEVSKKCFKCTFFFSNSEFLGWDVELKLREQQLGANGSNNYGAFFLTFLVSKHQIFILFQLSLVDISVWCCSLTESAGLFCFVNSP